VVVIESSLELEAESESDPLVLPVSEFEAFDT